ncbi:MAG: cupin domain-containing protein, partial [Promethearchaeota archaeon]
TRVRKKRPTDEELEQLNVKSWGIWEHEAATFPWEYDDTETFYVLEGEVEVEYPDGKIAFEAGDLVQFDAGVKCTWHIKKKIRKHYKFGDIEF